MIPLRRFTARVLPIDDQGRVLLLHGFDPARPEMRFWFTIGGAMEDGESLQEAAARELHEEVGIQAAASDFTGPYGTNTIEFSFAEYEITQDQTFFAIRVGDAEISYEHMEELEKATTLGHRWWTPEALETTDELIFPKNLTTLLNKITP